MAAPGVGHLLIGQPDYNDQAARLLDVKGELPDTLTGAYQLSFRADDFTRMEYRWLRRMTTWQLGLTQAAVAGQFSIFGFIPSALQRSLIVIERIIFTNPNAAAMAVAYGVTASGFGGIAMATTGHMLDDRQFRAASSGARGGVGTNAVNPIAGAGLNFSQTIIPASAAVELREELVLTNAPATTFQPGFIAAVTQVNLTLVCSIRWRERQLLGAEG